MGIAGGCGTQRPRAGNSPGNAGTSIGRGTYASIRTPYRLLARHNGLDVVKAAYEAIARSRRDR